MAMMRTGQEGSPLDGTFTKHKITKLFSFSGLRARHEETQVGDIVAIAGIGHYHRELAT
jgi:GTP-binding protein